MPIFEPSVEYRTFLDSFQVLPVFYIFISPGKEDQKEKRNFASSGKTKKNGRTTNIRR